MISPGYGQKAAVGQLGYRLLEVDDIIPVTVDHIHVLRPGFAFVGGDECDSLHPIGRLPIPAFPSAHRSQPSAIGQLENRVTDFETWPDQRWLDVLGFFPS